MNNVHDVDTHTSNEFDLHEHIKMLNGDQFHAFKMVSDHLHTHVCHQQRHEKGECLCKDFKPYNYADKTHYMPPSFYVDENQRHWNTT